MLVNKLAFRWIHNHIEFLKKQEAIFDSRPDAMSARITSDGYLTLALSPSGDQWTKMRKVMRSGVLTNKVFQRLYAKRRKEADHLVRYVYNQCKDPDTIGCVNVNDAACHYCSNVIRKMKGLKSEEDDILDLLINLKKSRNEPLLSTREIKALIVEIMIETVYNPSNAVEWALAEMINQPDILAKACEELN
ncbi:phenylalanine N-monooxygenase [Salvia divinorum]|uniref:Phenylalanine N-monooxygenase n=1 Tax=Salvia divinorum TaxID=28513 RepID=A0ABD1FZI5_SALDI